MSDLISRQAAIDDVCKMMYECFGADDEELDAIEVTLRELPAVQPDHTADVSKKVERTDETAQNVSDSDLISRKAVTDALAKFVPYAICDESTESYANGLTDAYNLILQLPSAQPEPQWIPCSERLPEKNCRCLTTNEAWGSFEVDWNAWIDGRWLYPNEKPIAWMPLPEPYRGGDE